MKIVMITGRLGSGVEEIMDYYKKCGYDLINANEVDSHTVETVIGYHTRLNTNICLYYSSSMLKELLQLIVKKHHKITSTMRIVLVDIILDTKDRILNIAKKKNLEPTDPAILDSLTTDVVIESNMMEDYEDSEVKFCLDSIKEKSKRNRVEIARFNSQYYKEVCNSEVSILVDKVCLNIDSLL